MATDLLAFFKKVICLNNFLNNLTELQIVLIKIVLIKLYSAFVTHILGEQKRNKNDRKF